MIVARQSAAPTKILTVAAEFEITPPYVRHTHLGRHPRTRSTRAPEHLLTSSLAYPLTC